MRFKEEPHGTRGAHRGADDATRASGGSHKRGVTCCVYRVPSYGLVCFFDGIDLFGEYIAFDAFVKGITPLKRGQFVESCDRLDTVIIALMVILSS